MSRRARAMAAKAEKKQQKIEAGRVSELFPRVAEISILMQYSQTGVLEPLSRRVNFFPGSAAVFKVNCLCPECIEGAFDFTRTISEMVKARKTASKGKISCDNCSAPECTNVEYAVMIKYAH